MLWFGTDGVAGIIHMVSSLLILGLPSNQSTKDTYVLSSGHRTNPLYFAAASAMWSSFCHFYVFMREGKERGELLFAQWRWIDYTISASLMVVPAAAFANQTDAYVVSTAVLTMAGTMLTAYMCETDIFRFVQERHPDLQAKGLAVFIGFLIIVAQAVLLGGHAGNSGSRFDVIVILSTIIIFAAISIALFGTWDVVEGRVLTVSASVVYAAVWAMVLATTEGPFAYNGNATTVVVVLVATHACFAPLFYIACMNVGLVRQHAHLYDATNSALSVMSKVVMHWLVFFVDWDTPTTIADPEVYGVVLAAMAAGCVVFLAHFYDPNS